MVPYCCAAFLPDEQRRTSSTFRRFCRFRTAEWLDLHQAAELVAFIRLVGFYAAMRIFRWTRMQQREAKRLVDHPPVWEASEAYHQANLAVLSEEDGLACWRAMNENGVVRGRNVPDIVMRALQFHRRNGMKYVEIGRLFGISGAQVARWVKPKRLKDQRVTGVFFAGA